MSEKMVSEDYKALEVICLEYVERFGLTPSARRFFEAQQSAESDKKIELFPASERRSA